jgi:lipid-binding SYLF domain-containing protein
MAWFTGKLFAAMMVTGLMMAPVVEPARAADAAEIDARADLALDGLLAGSPAARAVAERAVAVLVFPDVVKAGFGFGGQYGEGVLRRDGVTIGYFSIASASFGLQIGAQSYSQVLFFMTEDALATLDRTRGFELGADAGVALIDDGVGLDVSTTTLQDPVVAFVVGQRGLMAGVSLEGSKLSRIRRD